ncbi:MAG: FumA C-terminus/TtdB family hydratase beta subunit [Nitrososphaerota archaeon]|nr:FumA C-terminus/TtdB family hydratase beta subunit [Nitrososphaerota archaeon]
MDIIKLTTPPSEDEIRRLKVGDLVLIDGSLFIFSSIKSHMRALEIVRRGENLPMNLKESIIFHCPALFKKVGDTYEIVTIGATTSARLNPFTPELIKRFHIRGIIGKGGMDRITLEVMKESGCIYMDFIGGCSPLYVDKVIGVSNIYWLDLGIYEAVVEIKVKDFGPILVTMDSHGNSIYERVKKELESKIPIIYKELGI